MSTHEAIALGDRDRAAIVDDAGRGEFYVSVFDDGARGRRAAPGDARGASMTLEHVIRVADVHAARQRRASPARAARCEIETRGDGERYRDVTPIYVRLAEAEVKLQQK